MKQSVSSAQIDECAEIGNILNSSLYNIANCDACEQFFLQFLLLSNDELFAVTDDASSSRVELGNNEFNFLICIFRQIFSYTSDTRLAGMNTLVSSTTTDNPPFSTCVTFAFRTS